MKTLIRLLLTALVFVAGFPDRTFAQSAADQAALQKTTEAIRSAFARGDVAAAVALHHPNIKKWFGGENIVADRTALATGLTTMFRTSQMEFVDNKTESIIFNGDTAIETSLFTIKSTAKAGGTPTFAHGRAMVVYVRYPASPTGWASLREIVQWLPNG